MSVIRLLILEDAESQRIMYSDHINRFNGSNETVRIEPSFFVTINDAKTALTSGNFDCAIVDLRLRPDAPIPEGNEFVRCVVGEYRIPIIIVSGYMQDLDEDLANSSLLYKYDRDERFERVIEKIEFLYSTGITQMLGQKGRLEQYFTNVFWKHVYPNIEYISQFKPAVSDVEKVLLRYAISNLQEYLNLDASQAEFEEFLPIEMYINPPIKEIPFTGDILMSKDGQEQHYFIISPTCDMANKGKTNRVQLAEIDSPDMPLVQSLKASLNSLDEGTRTDALESMRKLHRNNYANRYHYLPTIPGVRGGYINFRKISSIAYKDVKNYEKVASVAEQFVRDITARFSQYYGRQGQPALHPDILEQQLVSSSHAEVAAAGTNGA